MATVCAGILAGGGCAVTVWGRNSQRTAEINLTRENRRYLPGYALHSGIQFSSDAPTAFRHAEFLLCAVPTQYIRGVLEQVVAQIPPGVPCVSVAKGIENKTLLRPTQIIKAVTGQRPVAALSGPSIAGELARLMPATLVVASEHEPLAREAQRLFGTRYLRIYRNGDLVGTELAGALKNVIAVAAGILDGIGAGNNAKAALLTRGLVEITRLGLAMGAAPETFAGLAGMGDLFTTCVSPEGRNRGFGEQVGAGKPPQEVVKTMVGVVEGLATTASVMVLAARHGVDMPISRCLYSVLFEGKNARDGMYELLARQPKAEDA